MWLDITHHHQAHSCSIVLLLHKFMTWFEFGIIGIMCNLEMAHFLQLQYKYTRVSRSFINNFAIINYISRIYCCNIYTVL